MKLFRNIKVGVRLSGSFFLVILVLAIGTIAGLYSLKEINQSNQSLYAERTLPIEALGDANQHLNDISGDLFQYLTIPRPQGENVQSLSSPTRCASCHKTETTGVHDKAVTDATSGVRDCTSCHDTLTNDPMHGQAKNQSIQQSSDCTVCHSNSVIMGQLNDTETSIRTDIAGINQQIASFRSMRPDLSAEEQAKLKAFETAWQAHQTSIDSLIAEAKRGNTRQAMHQLVGGDARTSHADAENAIQDLIALEQSLAQQAKIRSGMTFNSAVGISIISGLVGILLAVVLGYFLTRSVTLPLHRLTKTSKHFSEVSLRELSTEMNALARGDLTRSLEITTPTEAVHSKDEIGQLAQAFNEMIERLHETGKAFSDMTAGLRMLVRNVSENAAALNQASDNLANSANQSSEATRQIITTIEQVASGVELQTDTITRTVVAVEQTNQTIENVAAGVREQGTAIVEASNVTTQISAAIEQVSAAAQSQMQATTASRQATQSSTVTVQETIESMRLIQNKVSHSALKVQEMGQHSQKIGAIVSTIEEIASQTNLLALNAAIEAARAGEHGRGFAVVASEVGKLAEKSAAATQEISALIEGIQTTVDDVVQSMNENAGEVDHGMQLAGQAGQAMNSMLAATRVGETTGQEISTAARKMSELANDLVKAMDSVSIVVESNAAATRQMTAGSHEIAQSFEHIASVSEENSASAIEVSQSAGQMGNQIQEVTQSARALSSMAKTLQGLVAQFRVNGSGADESAKKPSSTAALNDEPKMVPLVGRRVGWVWLGLVVVMFGGAWLLWNQVTGLRSPLDWSMVVETVYPTATMAPLPTLDANIAIPTAGTPVPGAGKQTAVNGVDISALQIVATVNPNAPTPQSASLPFFAVWSNSPHADAKAEAFNHWNQESPAVVPAACARCHSTSGYQDYLGADGSPALKVDQDVAKGEVVACQACHNLATLTLTSVTFPSGKTVDGLGSEARCISCHQGRESQQSVDAAIEKAGASAADTPSDKLSFVNIHYAAAAASLYGTETKGGYEYPGQTYDARMQHQQGYTTCTDCHDPHSTQVKVNACQSCHQNVTTADDLRKIRVGDSSIDYNGNGDVKEGMAQEIDGLRSLLLQALQTYAAEKTSAALIYSPDVYPYFFVDTNGNGQGDEDELTSANAFKLWTPRMLKAAYNYQFSVKEPGAYAHNGPYMIELLYDSINDLNQSLSHPVDLSKAHR